MNGDALPWREAEVEGFVIVAEKDQILSESSYVPAIKKFNFARYHSHITSTVSSTWNSTRRTNKPGIHDEDSPAASSVPDCSCPQCASNSSEEGGISKNDFANFTDVEFISFDSRAKIVAWELDKAQLSSRYEGNITRDERRIVPRSFIKAGAKYSGIFRILARYVGPDGCRYKITGTAFAISRFHVLTAAHNVWDRKLGPATSVTLLLDEREAKSGREFKNCSAAACHIGWANSYQTESDFAVVTITDAFDQGVRIIKCMTTPKNLISHVIEVIGFPQDFPNNAPGLQVVESKGLAYVNLSKRFVIRHWANTEKGSSGSPVLYRGKAIGVHNSYQEQKIRNQAVPINHNGNNVDDFLNVLDRNTPLRFGPGRTGYTGEARVGTNMQIVHCFDVIRQKTSESAI